MSWKTRLGYKQHCRILVLPARVVGVRRVRLGRLWSLRWKHAGKAKRARMLFLHAKLAFPFIVRVLRAKGRVKHFKREATPAKERATAARKRTNKRRATEAKERATAAVRVQNLFSHLKNFKRRATAAKERATAAEQTGPSGLPVTVDDPCSQPWADLDCDANELQPLHLGFLGRSLRGGGAPAPKGSKGNPNGGSNGELQLLQGLQTLLQSFASTENVVPRAHGKTSGKGFSSSKGKGSACQNSQGTGRNGTPLVPQHGKGWKGQGAAQNRSAQNLQEVPLFSALQKIVHRASQNGSAGLLQRLQKLVEAASTGKQISPKQKQKKKNNKKASSPGPSSFAEVVARQAPTVGENWVEVKRQRVKKQSPKHVIEKGSSKISPPAHLLPGAWPSGAAMSENKLRVCLEKGDCPTGIVTWAHASNIPDLRRLAQVHQVTKAFALICLVHPEDPDKAPLDGGTKAVFPVLDSHRKPGLGSFWVYPLNKDLPKLPVCTIDSSSPKVERTLCTFRVQIPKRHLAPHVWKDVTKNPSAFLKPLIPAESFHSVFRWSEVTHKTKFGGDEAVLEGFLKTDQKECEQILKISGSKGIFISRLFREDPNPPKVWWIRPNDQETDLQYMARVQQLGISKKVPLCFRVGGGASLGLKGLSDEDPGPKLWHVQGVPRKWTAEDVIKCLDGAGCKSTNILRPPQYKIPWVVKTIVKPEHAFSPVVGIKTADGKLISLVRPPPKKSLWERKAVAPGIWQHPKAVPSSPVPVVETLDGCSAGGEPNAKRPKKEDVLPYSLLDCGGEGNCGWHCLSVAMCLNKGFSFDDALRDVSVTTKTLRADTCAHVTRHADDYKCHWDKDEGENEKSAAGSVPTCFEEWCSSLLRDKQWLCGLAIAAVARRCGVRIVVVESKNGQIKPPRAVGKGKRGEFPIILFLKDEHFQLIRKKEGHEFPRDWELARDCGEVVDLTVRGAGRMWAENTPSDTPDSPSPATVSVPFCDEDVKPKKCWKDLSPGNEKHSFSTPRKRLWGKSTPHSKRACGSDPSGEQSPSKKSMASCDSNNKQFQLSLTQSIANLDDLVGLDVGNLQSQNHEAKTWVCPVCQTGLTAKTSSSLAAAKKYHLDTRHPSFDRNLVTRQHPTVYSCSVELPEDQRGWSCPVCNAGLPVLPNADRLRAIRAHCKEKHPKESAITLSQKLSKGKPKPGTKAAVTKMHAKARKGFFKSHRIVEVPRFRHEESTTHASDRGDFKRYCCVCLVPVRDRAREAGVKTCKQVLKDLKSKPCIKGVKRKWWSNLQKQPQHCAAFLAVTGWTKEKIDVLLDCGSEHQNE